MLQDFLIITKYARPEKSAGGLSFGGPVLNITPKANCQESGSPPILTGHSLNGPPR